MSKTLSRHEAVTDARRESEDSLDSNVPERQPTLDDVFRDLKLILARKDEEISRLTKNTLALEDALVKIERLEGEVQKFHEQMISLKQQLEAKNKKIRAMKNAFKKAYEEEEIEDVAAESLLERELEQNLARRKDTTELHVNASLQGSRRTEMRDVMLVNSSADRSSEVKDPNADTGESAREPDGVADKSAGATSALRRACATGEPGTVAPPAKRRKPVDSARPFQCNVCGRAYCRAEDLQLHHARECGYLLAAESAREEQLSVEREERRTRRSTEQTVQVQNISRHKEKAEGEKSKANDNLHSHGRSLAQQLQQYRGAAEMPQGALRGLANPRPTQPSSTPGTTVTAGDQPQVMRPTCPTNPRTTSTSNIKVRIESMQTMGNIEQRQIAHEPASAGDARSAAVAQFGAARESEVRPTPAKKSKIVRLAARKYPCSGCKKKYRTRVSLRKHKARDCGKPSIECEGCHIFFRPRSYGPHLKKGSCSGGVPYKCEHCTTFSTLFKHSLVNHVRSCKLRHGKRLAAIDIEAEE